MNESIQLVLASSSPRRRELVSQAGIPFVTDAPEIDEHCALPPREAVLEIAHQAMARKCGARGLRAIIEDCMLDTMFELPGRTDINECVITRDSLLGGKPVLKAGPRRRSGKRSAKNESRPESEVS